MSDVAVEPKASDDARTYLVDRITECLLESEEPLRISEILAGVQQDGALTSRLIRAVLESSDRFQAVDRRWTAAVPEVDARRPLAATIDQLLQAAGRPLSSAQIARQLAAGLERPAEVLLPSVRQLLQSRDTYFPLTDDRWGLTAWLLDVDDHDEEEIVFRNFFFDEDVLSSFREKQNLVKWDRNDTVDSAVQFIQKVGEPVPSKVLQFFAWRAGHHTFHAAQFFADLFGVDEVTFLSSGSWVGSESVAAFARELDAMAEQLVGEEEEEEEEVLAEAAPEEVAAVVETYEVTENEVNEIAAILADLKSHRISEFIEAIFELTPGEKGYTAAFGNVWGAMGADERFAWVGGERWRLAGTVPRTLHKIPDVLELPYLPYFVNEDGEAIDVELEESGFEGDLVESVKDPRVMMAGQPIPEGTVPEEAPAKVRVPVRYGHRLAGVIDVYGDLRALFPTQPDIIELAFYHGSKSFTGWLNNGNNLVLEVGPLFDRLDLPLCGGVFALQQRARAGATDYTITYHAGDVDELVAVSDERLATLEAMREDPEAVETSTFDLMREIMAPYGKKGAHFVTLFTEVNVVRRTHAYLIASLLSAYACFTYLKPGYWGYDEKKVDQGIRKQKRKFIKE